MRIAIVGTRPPSRAGISRRWGGQAAYDRDLADYLTITRDVLRVLAARLARGPFTIVTGGAKGVDKLAEHFALNHRLPCIVIEPDYQAWPPKTAPVVRNGVIAAECDAMVAWPSRRGGGTRNAIEWAEKWGRPICVRQPWASRAGRRVAPPVDDPTSVAHANAIQGRRPRQQEEDSERRADPSLSRRAKV